MKLLYVSSHISSLHSVCSSKCLMKLRLSFGQGQALHASKDKYLSFYYDALALHWDQCVDSNWCEKELVWNHCRSSFLVPYLGWLLWINPNDEEMVRKYEMPLNHLLRIEATNRAMLLKSSGLSMRSCHPEPRGDFPVHQLGLQHLGHSSILKRGHIPLPGLLSMGYLPMFLAKNIQKDVETSKSS